jgi:hypothetical protein
MSIGTEVSMDLSENLTFFAPFLCLWHVNKLYYNCTYNRLPEDELSGSKHVEGIAKIKILV